MADLAQGDGAECAGQVSANGAVGVERSRGGEASLSRGKRRDQAAGIDLDSSALTRRLDSSGSDDDDPTPLKEGISFSSRTSRTSRSREPVSGPPASADVHRLPCAIGALVPYAKSRGTPSSPPPRPRPQQAPATNGPQLLGAPGGEARTDGQGPTTAGAGLINERGRQGQQESERSSLLTGSDPGYHSQGRKAASVSTGDLGSVAQDVLPHALEGRRLPRLGMPEALR